MEPTEGDAENFFFPKVVKDAYEKFRRLFEEYNEKASTMKKEVSMSDVSEMTANFLDRLSKFESDKVIERKLQRGLTLEQASENSQNSMSELVQFIEASSAKLRALIDEEESVEGKAALKITMEMKKLVRKLEEDFEQEKKILNAKTLIEKLHDAPTWMFAKIGTVIALLMVFFAFFFFDKAAF